MDNSREALFDLILANSFRVLDEPVLLSSGKYSDHYFDLKQVTGDPRGISYIAKIFHGRIMQIGGIKSVGGLESGSISISTAISQYSNSAEGGLSSFYVRKKRKEHGLSKWVEGVSSSPAVIIDDVITTGKSALRAFECLRDEGIDSGHLFAVVYRGTPLQREDFERENGIKLFNLFYEDEFISKHKP